MDLEEHQRPSCIRGYHVYKQVWTAIGEIFSCVRETSNSVDRYAVAVLKEDVVIGHLPKKISKVCSLFLRRGGSIHCQVTGTRQYSADLTQGGLEIPCELLFKAKAKEIEKIKKFIKKKAS